MFDFIIPNNVNINLTVAADANILAKLDTINATLAGIISQLQSISHKEDLMAISIADIQAAVADETSVVQSAVTLLEQLHQMLTDALANDDPAAMQAVLDAIAANKASLAASVAANTPTP